MAKEIKMDDADIYLCELSIRLKRGGGYIPGKYQSWKSIYNVLFQWEKHHFIPFERRLVEYNPFGRRRRKDCVPMPNVSKQKILDFIVRQQYKLHPTYSQYRAQQAYILQHGNLNGFDGTSECAVCGATLTGEAKTAQYAYACGEEGKKIHHLHVGNTHFCNLDCFEKYKAKYNQQLNTPKYD